MSERWTISRWEGIEQVKGGPDTPSPVEVVPLARAEAERTELEQVNADLAARIRELEAERDQARRDQVREMQFGTDSAPTANDYERLKALGLDPEVLGLSVTGEGACK